MEPGNNADTPTADDVRAALERIAASSGFLNAPKLTAFLRYVVEATLAGDAARIKGYTIGVEALGRPEDFDPQIDPIVRVEAGRLRHALQRYYDGAGRNDLVAIEIARGSYVPVFHHRIPSSLPTRAGIAIRRWREIAHRPRLMLRLTRRYRFAAAIVFTALGIGIAADLLWFDGVGMRSIIQSPGVTTTASVPSSSARDNNILPVIAIRSFEQLGTPAGRSAVLNRLDQKLRDALAHFDEISVLSALLTTPRTSPCPNRTGNAAGPRTDYCISATIEYYSDDSASITFRLIDAATDTIGWSRTFGRVEFHDRPDMTADGIVREVARTLAQPNGIIQALDRSKTNSLNPAYACLLTAIEGWRYFVQDVHQRARQCLEVLTAKYPNFSLAHTFLSYVYLRDDYLLKKSALILSADDRGFRMAQRAIELAPNSARAYAMLMRANAFRRDFDAAISAGRRAIELNPYDPLTAAELGLIHLIFGEVDRGLTLMRQNTTPSHIRPSWFNFGLCLANYLSDDLASATTYCNAMTHPGLNWNLMLRALVAAKSGDKRTARGLRDQLFAVDPAWRQNVPQMIGKGIFAPAIIEKLTQDFAAIGEGGT